MAKKAYIGVNGISKNVKNIYVGVNGVPKKVVKGYVGVNGVPKVFWDGGTPPTPVVIPSWDYWTSNRNDFLFKFIRSGDIPRQDKTFTKTTNKIAYYGIFKYAAIPGETIEYYSVMLLSHDRDAVTFRVTTDAGQDVEFYYYDSITDSQNLLWYYSVYTYEDAVTTWFDAPQKYFISDKVYEFWQRHAGGNVGLVEAANDMLDMIYAVPFHEDYQIGQEYRIPAYGDVRKTIRKIAGWQLAQNVSQYSTSTSYRTWSDNIDSTINTIITNINQHNNSSGMIIAQTLSDTDYGEYELFVMHGHFQTGYLPPKINYLDRAKILSSQQGQGNTHKLLEYYYDDTEGQYHWEAYYVNAGLMEWQISAKVYSDEPTVIDFQDDDTALSSIWGNEAFIGIFNRENRIDNVVITNIGIDL